MTSVRRLLPAAVAAATIAAAGCGGSGDAEPVATTAVEMAKSYRFEPAAVVVEAGSTVTWTNEDNFTHSVQVDGETDHEVEPGGSVSLTFSEPGTYHYVCRLHRRDMDGEVIVR